MPLLKAEDRVDDIHLHCTRVIASHLRLETSFQTKAWDVSLDMLPRGAPSCSPRGPRLAVGAAAGSGGPGRGLCGRQAPDRQAVPGHTARPGQAQPERSVRL